MENNTGPLNEIQKSIHAIEDASLIADISLSPVLNRSLFHLKKARETIHNDKEIVLPVVNKYLERNFNDYIEQIVKKYNFSQTLFVNNLKNKDVYSWESILFCLPFLSELVSVLKLENELIIKLENSKIIFESYISNEQEVLSSRKTVYAITRKLLSLNIILTYETLITDGKCRLLLTFDCSFDKESFFVVDFSKRFNFLLGTQSNLVNYLCDHTYFLDMEKSFCLEITDEMKLINYGVSDHKKFKQKTNCSFLHIAFLFRPLSIIIPNKGSLMNLSQIYTYTGSDQSVDINKTNKILFKTIDIFEFLRK